MWLSNKVYTPDTTLSCMGPRRGCCLLVRCVRQLPRPGYLVEGFSPPGTNSGEHRQDRFKETGVSALFSALWRVAGWEELQRARCCRWPVRGCFRLHAARASTSRDKPPPHGQAPGQHTHTKHTCLTDTSDNRARTLLMTRRPPISDQCLS